eukprot:5780929-Amphidinium_carterae.2
MQEAPNGMTTVLAGGIVLVSIRVVGTALGTRTKGLGSTDLSWHSTTGKSREGESTQSEAREQEFSQSVLAQHVEAPTTEAVLALETENVPPPAETGRVQVLSSTELSTTLRI